MRIRREKLATARAGFASGSGQGFIRPGSDELAQRKNHPVAHAIEAHSFSANITPLTLEAKIVQDADRLDSLGMLGVARTFYVAGRMGAALYDPQDPEAKHRDYDDTRFCLDHFQTKLLHLAEGFQTATGQRLAQIRHQRLKGFMEQFKDEIGIDSLANTR